MSGSLLVWAPDGVPEVAAGDDLAALLVARSTAEDFALADGDVVVVTSKVVSQGRGPGCRGSTARRRSPPRPCGWSPGAGRPASSRPGTGSCSPRPASTRPTPSRAPCCCCPSTPTPRPARCGPRLLELARRRRRRRRHRHLGPAVAHRADRPGDRRRRPRAAGRPARPRRRARQRARGDRHRRRRRDRRRPPTWSRASSAGGRSPWSAGWPHRVTREDGPGAAALVRPADEDMFRLGAREVVAGPAYRARLHRRAGRPGGACAAPSAAAVTAPAPHHTTPWRFVLVDDPDVRAVGCSTRCSPPGSPTCAATASPTSRSARRTRRGDVLRGAPLLVVPVPGRRRGARLPGRAAVGAPSARCSSSRWAPASRTCWSRWPSRASARPG